MSFKEVLIRFLKINGEYEYFLNKCNSSNFFPTYYRNPCDIIRNSVKNTKTLRKWSYYWYNNIHIKTSCIKEGDFVKFAYLPHYVFEVISVDWNKNIIKTKCDELESHFYTVKLSNVVQINQNKIKQHPLWYNEYYITKKQKNYGVD